MNALEQFNHHMLVDRGNERSGHPRAAPAGATSGPSNRPQSGEVHGYLFFAVGKPSGGQPQLILDRHEPVKLPPVLLLQGSADANGVVKDTNVSPAIQPRFAASYRAAGGKMQLELLPDAPHNFVNMAGPNLDRALALMTTFMEQQLARQ
jgi:alpha-beta hydrolase superfamily lysophospholipase